MLVFVAPPVVLVVALVTHFSRKNAVTPQQ
jgi:hypothetical protein